MVDLIRQNVEFRTGDDHAGVEHDFGAAIGPSLVIDAATPGDGLQPSGQSSRRCRSLA